MVLQQSNSQPEASSFQMAPGTTIPNDARKQKTTPSEPRLHQRLDSKNFNFDGIEASSSATAADQGTRMLSSTGDRSHMGDSLAGAIESRRNYLGNHYLRVSGLVGTRNMERTKSGRSEFDRFVGDNDLANDPIDGKFGVHQVRMTDFFSTFFLM